MYNHPLLGDLNECGIILYKFIFLQLKKWLKQKTIP